MRVKTDILAKMAAGKKMLAVLLDPENLQSAEAIDCIGSQLRQYQPDMVLIGGSTWYESVTPLVHALRPYTQEVPLVLFPGHPSQFSAEADAILFHSLLSGRNAETLIGWQTDAARAVRESGIEVISMGYILVDGGKESTTARVTGTKALAADRLDKIVDTALAGEMLGMQAIYLEAGSGAATPVGTGVIKGVRSMISAPLIVGGGICSREAAEAAWQAGADIVVVGNYLERHPDELRRLVNG